MLISTASVPGASAAGNGGLPRFLTSRAAGAAWLLAIAIVTLPSASYVITPGGEYQYQAAITAAFREHMQWGSQIIWTYGPLGYMNVLAYMDFHTWVLALFANLVAHAAFFAVLALFLVRVKARPWQWLLIGAIILVFFDRYRGFDFERFPVLDHKAALTAVLLLFLAAEAESGRTAAAYAGAAGLVIGFLLLDKGTFIPASAGLVVAFAILSFTRGKARPVWTLLAAIVISFLVLWVLAGQDLTGIPGYFHSAYELAAGYPAAMSWFTESPNAHPSLQRDFAIAMLLAAAACFLVALARRDRSLAGLLLLAAPVVFIAYKNSFVREDEAHALTFWSLMAVVLGLVIVRAATSPDGLVRRATAALSSVTIAACAVLVLGLGAAIGNAPELRPALLFPDNLTSYRHAASLIVRPDRQAEEDAMVVDGLRAAYPLPADVVDTLRQGDVDVVPWDLQLAFAYDLQWNPQPVLQSYSAYRPYLDQSNAQHFLGSNAPRFVVLTVFTIDGRYPLFDEPQAYRALLDRYQLRYELPDMLVFERRTDQTTVTEQALGSATASLGGWIPVPSHGSRPLYGRVRVDYSPLGLALNLVDRPPELHVRFQYSGGQVSPSYRYVPAVGPDGLLVSGYVPDAATFADLAQGRFDRPIEAIQISADSPAQAYQDTITVDFFTEATS